MDINKLKAFTMAEVMVLLLTLSIMLAAFAPVMTKRQLNVASDNIWSFVPIDQELDSYYDTLEQSLPAQAFVGISPANSLAVSQAVQNDNNKVAYSKLIIRPSNKLPSSKQNQIMFRAGASELGEQVGNLFAGASNLLLGGEYSNLRVHNDDVFDNQTFPSARKAAFGNTAFGYNSLSGLINGQYNTAIGYYAMYELKTGKFNTAIGANAAKKLTDNENNTIIGYKAATDLSFKKTGSTSYGNNNTIIGLEAMAGADTSAKIEANTVLGYKAFYNPKGTSIGNTVAGYNVFSGGEDSSYNTVIGNNSMMNLTKGNYNTAFGYNSCNSLLAGDNKTCIGANAGSPRVSDNKTPFSNLFTGNYDRVFIGAMPRDIISNVYDPPAAVLEVHNIPTRVNKDSLPIENVGNESVVINGNLIVRGQAYFEAPILRNGTGDAIKRKYDKNYLSYFEHTPKGLVAFKLEKAFDGGYMFYGYDGADRTEKSYQVCKGRCKRHDFNEVSPNCICTTMSSTHCDHHTTYVDNLDHFFPVSTSYDWVEPSVFPSNVDTGIYDWCYGKMSTWGSQYTDEYVVNSNGKKMSCTAILEYNPSFKHGVKRVSKYDFNIPYKDGDRMKSFILRTDKPLAHMRDLRTDSASYDADWKSNPDAAVTSCCPDLKRSDSRLKNIGKKFTAGLEEIKRLNIYNYTFKDDASKRPHVGVIAQDLKVIFPDAVTKDEHGYYQIRWDEMFYALINSIKTVHSRVQKLSLKIASEQQRIHNLKVSNAKMNAQLDKLENELVQLEKKKHR